MPSWTMAGMLNRMMKEAGLNQQQLADKADISVGTLGKILREETKEPERPTLMKLASAFGLSEVDLQLQLQKWNAQSPDETSPAPLPERRADVSDRARDFARRYDNLTRMQQLALDAALFAFEDANEHTSGR